MVRAMRQRSTLALLVLVACGGARETAPPFGEESLAGGQETVYPRLLGQAGGGGFVRQVEAGEVEEVQLRAGEMRRIDVTLHDERRAASVWPWIVGGVALAAGAAVGGYFLFRTSDPGPAPVTGGFATVKLSVATGVGR